MDSEYPLFSQLDTYLAYLDYRPDESQKIGNTEYWENATGDFVIFSRNSHPITQDTLTNILCSINKEEKDFKAYCLGKEKGGI